MTVGSHATIRLRQQNRDWRWLWLRRQGITVRGYVSSWQVDSNGRAWLELDNSLLDRMRRVA